MSQSRVKSSQLLQTLNLPAKSFQSKGEIGKREEVLCPSDLLLPGCSTGVSGINAAFQKWAGQLPVSCSSFIFAAPEKKFSVLNRLRSERGPSKSSDRKETTDYIFHGFIMSYEFFLSCLYKKPSMLNSCAVANRLQALLSNAFKFHTYQKAF